MIFLKHLLVDLTILSNTPPHQGALGKLNNHFTLILDKYCLTLSSLAITSITLAAALKVLPLSETKRWGSPLLAQNLLRLQMNVSVDISGTMSMLTALVTQQVYKQIHLVRPCVLMYSGPAKSTPVVENGGASLTRNSGNGGGAGEQYGLPSNLRHTAHRCQYNALD